MMNVASRWMGSLLLWVLLGILLVGCRGGDTPSPDPLPPSPTLSPPPSQTVEIAVPPLAAEATPVPTASPRAEPIVLRWRTRPDNQAEVDVYQAVSESLDEELAHLTLRYEPGNSETSSYQTLLRTQVAAGTAPDVFWIPGTDIADFAKRGLILDLGPYAAADPAFEATAFYEEAMTHLRRDPTGAADGTPLWGLPRDVSTFVLYLNLDLIAEAGAPDPRELAAAGEWDWDSFLEVAQAVEALDPSVRGFGQNAWWATYGAWVYGAGGSFFSAARDGCALDSEAALRGLAFARDLYQVHDVAVPYGEDAEPPFLAGQVGMFQNGRWATPAMRQSADFRWDVVKLPDGPAGPSNWLFWGAYVVNSQTEHREAAYELVHALTRADIQAQVARLGANIPSRNGEQALEPFLASAPPQNNAAFLQGLSENPEPEGPLWEGSWPEFDARVDPIVAALLSGELDMERFAERICQEADLAFAE